MRSIYLVAGAATILGLFAACGGDSHPTVADNTPNTSGSGNNGGRTNNNAGKPSSAGEGGDATGGTSNHGNAGEGGEGDIVAPPDPLGPHVVITSPAGVDDPNQNGVLISSTVDVTCEVTASTEPGAASVNESSVKISVLDHDGKMIADAGGTLTKKAGQYTAELPLTNVSAGAVSFVCQATDIQNRVGNAIVNSLLDKGPTISIVEPEATSAHALSQPLDIDFSVAAAPIADDDTHAGVNSVTLDVAGVAIDLADAQTTAGHYRLQVNLTDPKFNPTPNGTVPVTVTATNKRTPSPVAATLTRPTSIDGAGPVIAFTSPVDKDVVGGTVRLSFSVSDAISGVDPSSVVVSLNDQKNTYDPASDRWSHMGNNFAFEFDSRQVKNSKVQITVNVGAKDTVGNVSPVSAELLYLDNYPPSVDLDPYNVRARTLSGTPRRCSGSFDPVGDDAKNDLGSAEIAATFRALIWDNTNTATEIPQPHFSTTNPTSVRLYLSEGATPLLIDKDHDGTCDEVAQVDSSDSIDLNPVSVSDTPWYKHDPDADPAPVACDLATVDAIPPPGLCTDGKSPMWEVIQDNYNKIPVIYARGVTSGKECTGVAWEFATKLTKNGWVCFAARASDYVGNVGVSRPLRVCVDNQDFGPSPACAVSSEPPPSCTDSCTPPPRVNRGLVDIP